MSATPPIPQDWPSLPLEGLGPFDAPASVKDPAFLHTMQAVTQWHRARCAPYAQVLERLFPPGEAAHLHELPYLPVRLFKTRELRSVDPAQVIKTLTSSGTSGQAVSKIYLDRETSLRQSRALAAIMASFLGRKRWPMLIVDSSELLKDRRQFSARAAAILGFSLYGRDHSYCLDGSLALDAAALQDFLDRHADTPVLLFGFTFIVWQGLYQSALRQGLQLRLPPGSLLIHGGGWKRLTDQQVDNASFKRCLQQQFGIEHVHNYYGMVEQVGSIFMECEHGSLHVPGFADVLVRHPHTLQPQPPGERGLIQVLSALPLSYPGHSLLTEDVGVIHGRDDCPCGRQGARLSVLGRLAQVELRGCSDTRALA